jgi:hypothetical protein
MKQRILICLPLLLFCYCLHAQSQFTGWLASFNTTKMGRKTSLHYDIQWRSSDEFKHTQTLLLRGGLNLAVSKKFVATVGYAFIHNRRVSGPVAGYVPEHRIWQQLIFNHTPGRIIASHRLRLEQRFLARTNIINNQLEKDGFNYANRFRYFIRSLVPFRKQASFKKGPFAALQNEVFVNIGNRANVNGEFFDQNRLYLAFGWRINTSFDIEAGYLNQYINGQGRSFTNNHVAQLAGYLRL